MQRFFFLEFLCAINYTIYIYLITITIFKGNKLIKIVTKELVNAMKDNFDYPPRAIPMS